MSDPINPDHYKQSPSGVECITVTEHMNFNLGNAVKYIWRCGLKSGPSMAATEAAARNEQMLEDLKKARWYIDREISRLAPPAMEILNRALRQAGKTDHE